MQLEILDSILIIANPIIIIVQALMFSRMLKNYRDLLSKSYESRWELLKEHFEYRNEICRERLRNGGKIE